MTPRRLLGALFATSLLFGVACGDDDAGPVGDTEVDGSTGDPAGQAPGLPPGENDTEDPSVADTAPQGAPEGAPTPDDDGGGP